MAGAQHALHRFTMVTISEPTLEYDNLREPRTGLEDYEWTWTWGNHMGEPQQVDVTVRSDGQVQVVTSCG